MPAVVPEELRPGQSRPAAPATDRRLSKDPRHRAEPAANKKKKEGDGNVLLPPAERVCEPSVPLENIIGLLAQPYPNPMVMAGALSQIARRAKIAVLGPTLPILNPMLVAEELAMIDTLSGGRLARGEGLGFRRCRFLDRRDLQHAVVEHDIGQQPALCLDVGCYQPLAEESTTSSDKTLEIGINRNAWLLDPADQLAARLAEGARANLFTSRKPIPRSRSVGRAATASRDRRSPTRMTTPAGSLPSSATRPTSSPR